MSECLIAFPGSVSKSTISNLVIEYIKYVLYYRGQFPLPLDQMKKLLKIPNEYHLESLSSKKQKFFVYSDSENYGNEKEVYQANALVRNKANLMERISKFEAFFNCLLSILLEEEVFEIVLNLGSNILFPKEMYRIQLPMNCSHSEGKSDFASFQHCQLYFFRAVMGSTIWNGLKTDTPVPISVLLLMKHDVTLSESMELKSFYTLPKNCIHRTIMFENVCCRGSCQKAEEPSNSSFITQYELKSNIWVKLKPELKGFTANKLL